MSAPCIFSPFIRSGGEVAGERGRGRHRGKSGRVTAINKESGNDGGKEWERRGKKEMEGDTINVLNT